MDREISDKDVYPATMLARELIGKSGTALDIMVMTKRILEYKMDVQEDVQYVVEGLCRRTVFEYAKRRMSRKPKISYDRK